MKFRESCLIMSGSCHPPKGDRARATKGRCAPMVLVARSGSPMSLPMSWSDHKKALAMAARFIVRMSVS